ncbi:MAG: pyruvate, phosphate dikinase, partial [Bacilli bacterium]
VFSFNEGNKEMRDILGGKGANLAEMTNLGLPVPNGFTISTTACNSYYTDGLKINDTIKEEILAKLNQLEIDTNQQLGNLSNPLLLSIRSGARASMPGMMDTILNLGINDEMVKASNNKRFINDCYRRLIAMYADVVHGNDHSLFENIIIKYKKIEKVTNDFDLSEEVICKIVEEFKKLFLSLNGHVFPQDPFEQLMTAITAVFRSWQNDRAKIYRKLNNIPDSFGTAVNVQQMVYGNVNSLSGTGVAFTRNPATGDNTFYGEYLINAQGEDIVAGVRTPKDISTLKDIMPNIYEEFVNYGKTLEDHYHDMQDMEFTIQNGKLYILQTRSGKRTGAAALKIALDLLKEGKISPKEAILMVEPNMLSQLLYKSFDTSLLKEAIIIGKGIAASPGAAVGKIFFNSTDIINNKDVATILVRDETSSEDIAGMHFANGIVTVRGGMTSHAAVVARGMGKCCVCGCSNLLVDTLNKTLIVNDVTYKEGDFISVDGTTGLIYKGSVKTVEPVLTDDFNSFMDLVSSVGALEVRANADTYEDALVALKFKAAGIGLVRTEHMFFNDDRIMTVQAMILADSLEERQMALDKLLKMQASDFLKIFKVMNGLPVTVRYLDPPLHEFLPKSEASLKKLAKFLKKPFNELRTKCASLHEVNPMMGHRGCRLSITYPEIVVMQTKAIMEAMVNLEKLGLTVKLELMIPLVSDVKEFSFVRDIVVNEIKNTMSSKNIEINSEVGTMIEVPRACITANIIAKEAAFFSFGTNDLTQMVFGFSRDDAAKFLTDYYRLGIFKDDPFVKLDINGVGKLMTTAVKLAKMTNKDIKLGICGEHGGEPSSVAFCQQIGLDYVSCSPYRVPVAKLSAAIAKIVSDN